MASIPDRLVHHTLVATVLFSGGVLAPAALLFGWADENVAVLGVGLALLASGVAPLVGAAVFRCIDRTACSATQRRLFGLSAWLLNPVFVAIAGVQLNIALAWWSGLPLAGAVALSSGCLRLVEGDPDWEQEGCPPRPHICMHWLFSRMVFVALPMCLLSFQAALYLPCQFMLPQGPEVGLFVCGGCVLISVKFCAMCHCLARQRVAQAFVLAVLLSADWISSLHMMEIVGDNAKIPLLLLHLLVAGVVQLRSALVRLSLRLRWSRALARRRAGVRDIGVQRSGVDVELGAHINEGGAGGSSAQLESSDSDDERGPGSLPDGFHEALMCVLGVPLPSFSGARRQFLCGLRSAVVDAPAVTAVPGEPQPQQQAATGDSSSLLEGELATASVSPAATVRVTEQMPAANVSSAGAATATQGRTIEVSPDDQICTVCQDEIRTGDLIRPLPKCSHVFHAACLERWAKTMREATRCPTCRRPALARRAAEGAVSIQALTACGDDDRSPSAPSSRGGPSGGGRGGSGGRQVHGRGAGRGSRRAAPPTRGQGEQPPPRITRPTAFARSIAVENLRASLGVSEAMALAALDCAGGAADVAAHLVLEYKTLVEAVFVNDVGPVAGVPAGVVEAFVAANPNLEGSEVSVHRHLMMLSRSNRAPVGQWADLTAAQQQETFRVALEDVARRLQERAG